MEQDPFQKTREIVSDIQDEREALRRFLYPHELEEYDLLEKKEQEKALTDKEYAKLFFFRFLAGGMVRDKAEEIGNLAAKNEKGGLSDEEKERLRYLYFYKHLVNDRNDGFVEKNVDDFWDLENRSSKSNEKLPAAEYERLIMYRFLLDGMKHYTKEQASRAAKLIVMNDHGLLSEAEKEEMEKLTGH